MGRAPSSRGSPRTHYYTPYWGLILLNLLLLLVEQTNSQYFGYDEPKKYESWNYGRNQVIQALRNNVAKMNDRFDNIENTLNELKNEIQNVRRIGNIPLTHEEKLAKLSCPKYFEPINSTLECILVAKKYATYKEATESCEKYGARLAVPKDMKVLGDFVIDSEYLPQSGPPRGPPPRGPPRDINILTHDVYWIGADNNLGPDQMRWVDGKPVDIPITVFSTESTHETDDSLPGNLCGVLPLDKVDDDDFGEKLTVKQCAESQRYPYICEIDSGSEHVEMDMPEFYTEFQSLCPADYSGLQTGECLYISQFNETLDYFRASKFCAARGASLVHPRNLSILLEEMNDYHRFTLQDSSNSSNNGVPIEYGIWLSNSVVDDDQDWADLMQETAADPGRDMCTLFKAMPSKPELHKDVASCSSNQRFLCSLNLHPKIAKISELCQHRRC